MRRLLLPALLLLMISGPVMAQDDFRRERGRDNDIAKNALEGKTKEEPARGGGR